MPRPPKGRWDARRRRWVCKYHGTLHTLKTTDGQPIPKDRPRDRDAAIRRLIDREARRAAEGPSTAEVAALYLQWLAEQGRSLRTRQQHDRELLRLCTASWNGRPIGTLPASTVPPEAVWSVEANLPEGSRRNFVASVKACIRWACTPQRGRLPAVLIPPSPLMTLAPIPARSRAKEPPPWDVVLAMIRAAWEWVTLGPKVSGLTPADRAKRALCFELQAWTGCRTHEAAGLQWSEIADGMVRIDPSRVKTRGRGQPRPRAFPVPPGWLETLHRWREINPPDWHDRWVFARPQRTTEPPSGAFAAWIANTLRPWCASRGVEPPSDFTGYSLRHLLNTEGHEIGLGTGELAAASGHSPSVNESTYRHVREQAIRETYRKLWKRRGEGEG